jgi:hypothetical protein
MKVTMNWRSVNLHGQTRRGNNNLKNNDLYLCCVFAVDLTELFAGVENTSHVSVSALFL